MRSNAHSVSSRRSGGFTLIELLVVIAILAALAAVLSLAIPRFLDKGKKVGAIAQARDIGQAYELFEQENGFPLLPDAQREAGVDTVYGAPGGKLSNAVFIAVLRGKVQSDARMPEGFDMKQFRRVEGSFFSPKISPRKTQGMGPDGIFYDPWGKEWMMAVNGRNAFNQAIQDVNPTDPGRNDKLLYTEGLADYRDTKPREEAMVMWTYGPDNKKGVASQVQGKYDPHKPVTAKGSDDVLSW